MSLPKPTHKVSFYGVRCYTDERSGCMWGCNKFWDALIPVVSLLHNLIVEIVPGAGQDGFPLVILEEYESGLIPDAVEVERWAQSNRPPGSTSRLATLISGPLSARAAGRMSTEGTCKGCTPNSCSPWKLRTSE